MSDREMELLQVYDLKKEYEAPNGALEILKGINFKLHTGELAFILGRSGSGKTTFLNILGGLDKPSSGKVVFEGEDLTQMSARRLTRVRNLRLGFVFQFYHLMPELTLYENVILPAIIAGQRNDAWANDLLKRVKLYSRKDHYPSELSGGEKQRAAIARALVNKPSVVFCDEPTGNLDQDSAESITKLIVELNRHEGQSFVIVTHDEALAWRYNNVYRLTAGVLSKEVAGNHSGVPSEAL